ncbi:MAG: hypothetical protein GX418_12245 [Clostridiales bacterium]|nr:hypothetical protein [Clostridiales bacterium]
MKRILAILMCILMVVVIPVVALAETTVDGGQIATQVVAWVLCSILAALGALATWAVKKYAIPWIQNIAAPWLEQHNLLEAAKTAVEYAEAALGRYNGEDKLKMALAYLQRNGWNIESENVLAAVQAKWQELNLAQITAGVKEALNDTQSTEQATT